MVYRVYRVYRKFWSLLMLIEEVLEDGTMLTRQGWRSFLKVVEE